MNPAHSENAQTPPDSHVGSRAGVILTLAALASVAVLVWFFCFETRYGPKHVHSTLGWLKSAWNPSTDYEHGKLVPFVILGLIVYRFKEIRASVQPGSLWGLLSVVVGCLFYVAAYRTLQPRVAVAGLPFILWGAAHFLWGWRVAKLLAFPLFFLWIAIPLPTFQQATTHLQLLATSLAHHGSGLLGVETYTQGTTVLPVKGDWKPLSIAHGCSGIRSLMALLMISATWAYVAKIALWKKILLFLSAVPLAIVGNALRVISIFVIAEHGNAEWASTTWHDWSGLLLFYPFSLMLLLAIHSLLEGGLPWKAKNRRELRRTRVAASTPVGELQKP
ncbi:MAG: exosortase/archaeosortase family protein [Luteolibacter sp.]|jgi:exosortase|nr:exosortase/archaeosortase family protein [Luteolibacter sp.]